MRRSLLRDSATRVAKSAVRRGGASSASSDVSVDDSRLSRRGGKRAGEVEEPPSSAVETDERAKSKTVRLTKAGRMKRAPLLPRAVVSAVHSAVAGEARKATRGRLAALFARYDTDDNQCVSLARFRKCVERAGIQLESGEDYEALARCFLRPDGDGATADVSEEEKAGGRVDYAAFVDFACSTRDSALLSDIADQMRQAIDKYERRRGARRLSTSSSARYNMGNELKRLDKTKQGWIPSERVEEFFDELDGRGGPVFSLSGRQIAALVDRFEYEYEKETLGFDYAQFSQWLQPLLHLDVKQLHARVKDLVLQANKKHGWKLGEVFETIDEDRDGEIDALELKEALLDMGLPLTDTQIRALVEEYDVDGDRQIQYQEFVSFFAPESVEEGVKSMKAKIKKATATPKSGSDDDASDSAPFKHKSRTKRNVRNTFSWGIAKAFARKQSVQSTRSSARRSSAPTTKSAKSSSDSAPSSRAAAPRRKTTAISSSDEAVEPRRVVRKSQKARRASSSSAASSPRDRTVKSKRRKAVSDNQSEESSSVAASTRRSRGRESRAKSSARSKQIASSTDSEGTRVRRKPEGKTASHRRKMTSESEAREQTAFKSIDDTEKSPQMETKTRRRVKSSIRRRELSKSSSPERSARIDASSRPRSPTKNTRQQSSRSSRHLRQRDAGHSAARTSARRQRGSRRAQPSNSRRKRSTSRSRRHSSTSPHEWRGSDSASSNDSSASGIDAEQLRQLKRSSRQRGSRDVTSGGEGSGDERDDGTASDAEYYKHLNRALRRAFDFFDLDKSDAIEKRELDHVLRALGYDVTPKELEAELKRSDLDRNGQLDFREFAAFVKRQLRCKAYVLTQKREVEIRHAFEALDTDKNGVLDEKEFEYLVYKVLQVELSVEEQDALLDFVDTNGDGAINVEEFIAFMKAMEDVYRRSGGTGPRSLRRQHRFLAQLDGTSRLASSAIKKLVRGAPVDIDRNLLMFFDIPTNFRPAISSAATCRGLHANSMAHALSFPSPQVVTALAHSGQRLLDTREASARSLLRREDAPSEWQMLQQAEGFVSQAIVSLKRATGVPKPFDTREDDVVKRCVHVCLFQEREEAQIEAGPRRARLAKNTRTSGSGVVVGNIHQIPVHWHPGEEDVWEFSKKATKTDRYKFLLRANAVNDRLYLLIEFIVHLKMSRHERRRERGRGRSRGDRSRGGEQPEGSGGAREMVCCWCKVPVRALVAKQPDPLRLRETLWGGTAHAPVDIERDEILRRRTGWRAVASLFATPASPAMGIKSVAIEVASEELQRCVPKLPPTILAPVAALPVLAEYMTLVQSMLTPTVQASSVLVCDPVLQLLPKIVDDHEALSVFRRVFDAEVAPLKAAEQRQRKFRELVLRMWPTFVEWRDRLPPSLLSSSPATATASGAGGAGGASTAAAAGTDGASLTATETRATLLQGAAAGKLRLQDVLVPCAPFHVREVAFQRRL